MCASTAAVGSRTSSARSDRRGRARAALRAGDGAASSPCWSATTRRRSSRVGRASPHPCAPGAGMTAGHPPDATLGPVPPALTLDVIPGRFAVARSTPGAGARLGAQRLRRSGRGVSPGCRVVDRVRRGARPGPGDGERGYARSRCAGPWTSPDGHPRGPGRTAGGSGNPDLRDLDLHTDVLLVAEARLEDARRALEGAGHVVAGVLRSPDGETRARRALRQPRPARSRAITSRTGRSSPAARGGVLVELPQHRASRPAGRPPPAPPARHPLVYDRPPWWYGPYSLSVGSAP